RPRAPAARPLRAGGARRRAPRRPHGGRRAAAGGARPAADRAGRPAGASLQRGGGGAELRRPRLTLHRDVLRPRRGELPDRSVTGRRQKPQYGPGASSSVRNGAPTGAIATVTSAAG